MTKEESLKYRASIMAPVYLALFAAALDKKIGDAVKHEADAAGITTKQFACEPWKSAWHIIKEEGAADALDAQIRSLGTFTADGSSPLNIFSALSKAAESKPVSLEDARTAIARILRDYSDMCIDNAIYKANDDRAAGLAPAEVAKHLMEAAKAIKEESLNGCVPDFSEQMADAMAHFTATANSTGELVGVTSGYEELDKLTQGWQKGKVYGVAARSNVGKTLYGINLAINAAESGAHVAYCSTELTDYEFISRLVSAYADIPSWILNHTNVDKEKQKVITQAMQKAGTLPIVFVHVASVADVATVIDSMRANGGIDLVIIDYAQALQTDDGWHRADLSALRAVSHAIQQLAISENLPIIDMLQLNRNAETQKISKAAAADGDSTAEILEACIPTISDIYGSDSFAQDSSMVMYLHRPNSVTAKQRSELRNAPAESFVVGLLKTREPAGLGQLKLALNNMTGRLTSWTDADADIMSAWEMFKLSGRLTPFSYTCFNTDKETALPGHDTSPANTHTEALPVQTDNLPAPAENKPAEAKETPTEAQQEKSTKPIPAVLVNGVLTENVLEGMDADDIAY